MLIEIQQECTQWCVLTCTMMDAAHTLCRTRNTQPEKIHNQQNQNPERVFKVFIETLNIMTVLEKNCRPKWLFFYYNHSAMRLYANSQQICMLPSCSYVPYHQQDICCQRVSSSCSNQCASFSTSLWATSIRRRKKCGVIFIHDQLFNSTFFHSPLRFCMYSPLYNHPKRQINIEWLSCSSIQRITKSSSLLIFALVRRSCENSDGINFFFHLCNKVDEDPLCG